MFHKKVTWLKVFMKSTRAVKASVYRSNVNTWQELTRND